MESYLFGRDAGQMVQDVDRAWVEMLREHAGEMITQSYLALLKAPPFFN